MSSVVQLDGRSYYIDRRQFTRQRAKDFRNEPDSGERIPEERGVKANEIWSRVQNDWSLGAGQELNDSTDSSARRFRSSVNFDPFTRGELKHSKQITDWIRDDMEDHLIGGPHFLASNGQDIFLGQTMGPATTAFIGNYDNGFVPIQQVVGSERHFCTAITVGRGFEFIMGTAQRWVVRAVTDVSGNPIWEDIGQAPGGPSDQVDAIGYALGRLVVGVGHKLYEMDSAGVCTLIYEHHNDLFKWKGIVESPNGLYLWGWLQIAGDEDQYPSYGVYDGGVFFMSVEEFDGALAAPYKVLPLPEGEYVYDLIYYGGYVFVSTNVGVRMAQVNELGYLVYGPALEIPYAGGIFGRGESIYVGFSNYNVGHCDSNVDNNYWHGVAVIKLRELVDNLTPPFAMVYAYPSNQVEYRRITNVALDGSDVIFLTNENPEDLNIFQYVEPAMTASLAHMRMGFSSFGTSEDVRILSVGMKAQTEFINEIENCVGIRYLHQDPAYTFPYKADEVISDEQGVNITVFKDTDIRTRRAELALTQQWVDGSPVWETDSTIYQIQMEASPVHFYSEKIMLPLLFADWVRDDYGVDVSLDLDNEWKILSDLMNNKTYVTLKMGGESFRGFVQQLEMRPETLMEYSRAIENQESMLSGFIYVTFHTIPGYE